MIESSPHPSHKWGTFVDSEKFFFCFWIFKSHFVAFQRRNCRISQYKTCCSLCFFKSAATRACIDYGCWNGGEPGRKSSNEEINFLSLLVLSFSLTATTTTTTSSTQIPSSIGPPCVRTPYVRFSCVTPPKSVSESVQTQGYRLDYTYLDRFSLYTNQIQIG